MKSKFGFLLSAGGSMLSKDKLRRRFHLPGWKKKSAAELDVQVAPGQRPAKLRNLGQVIERIIRDSRGQRRAKQI